MDWRIAETVLKLRKGDQNPGAHLVDIKMKGTPQLCVASSIQRRTNFSLSTNVTGGGYSFHRADVQDVLLAHLSPCVTLHLSYRLGSYKQVDNHLELEFKDGKTASCDLLIGADGVNSAVRRSMLTNGRDDLTQAEKEALYKPVWTGGVTYRALIDAEVVRKEMPNHSVFESPILYGGKNKHVIIYAISGGKIINAVPFFIDPTKDGTQYEGPVVVEETTDDIPAVYAGWEDEVQIIIKNITKASRWAIQQVKPLDSYVSGRVGLLGDAAHAMPPHLGNGAGQAIEDAFILANLISKSVRSPDPNPTRVLQVYDTVRQPFGNFVARASKHQGNLDDFAVPGYEDLKEGQELPPEMLKKHGEALDKGWEWTWNTSLMGDLEKVLAML
ncbi:hypothetical protein NLJ89_g9502 [Agrocybe chaxingu]|uniref:FAD-binding domain-containing protein n=1 Tax=Agrocybe chaxingu TaxID=84603 RepID=A0A9W8MT18_9AGAR|nr:hypothetical protein NLJ89_g9502 [Agrocybe chaxingu]